MRRLQVAIQAFFPDGLRLGAGTSACCSDVYEEFDRQEKTILLKAAMFLEGGVWQCEFDMGGDRYRSIVEIRGDGERARNVINHLRSGGVSVPSLKPTTLKRLDQRPPGLLGSAEGADRSIRILTRERL
jgi:hypothetical protein